jgi:hypothetical protein
MDSWAKEELKYADLGDRRRNRRLVKIVSDLAAHPHASIPEACGNWAATQGCYDLWSNPRVKACEIRAAHQRSTLERIKNQPIVLAIQDTTEFNFTHHPNKKGMGYLDSSKSRGLKVHSTFCVSSAGIPLGLLNQEVWARDIQELGKKHDRHRRATLDKESQRWITALLATDSVVPPDTIVVTVADAEADIYDLFSTPRNANSELLIRGHHNRCVRSSDDDSAEVERLSDVIRRCTPIGQKTLDLKATEKRGPRQAVLTLRTTSVEIQPPKNHPHFKTLNPIKVTVILAEEESPPPDVDPVSWLLLTTLPVSDVEDVEQCLIWYSYRWLIERYHYVLKSGCSLEELQLETADRIEKALATYSIVAWRLLWLTYISRTNPSAEATKVLEPLQWQALYCFIHSVTAPPSTPPTVNQCIRWIAQLGGFLGRKGDGEPGVKTIWRGLRRLEDIAQTWKIFYPSSSPPVNDDYVKKYVSKA